MNELDKGNCNYRGFVFALKNLTENRDWKQHSDDESLKFFVEKVNLMQAYRNIVFQYWVIQDLHPKTVHFSMDVVEQGFRETKYQNDTYLETLRCMDRDGDLSLGPDGISLTRQGVETLKKKVKKLPGPLAKAYTNWIYRFDL